MKNIEDCKISYICYPYNASLHTGRGHDRYAFRLIEEVRRKCKNVSVWESKFKDTFGAGNALTMLDGAMQECVFPFKFYKEKADIFHATSAAGGKTIGLLKKTPRPACGISG